MKKGMLIGLSLGAVLVIFAVIIFVWGKNTYNNMVTLNETVTQSWSQVENQYQRRSDLIPNLVETVKGYANFEKSVLVDVTEARAKVSQLNVNKDVLNDPQAFQKFQALQGSLSGALSRLLVTVEKYPELKANQNFLSLQAQLEGTENRIAVERKRFNETVQNYNTTIKLFPASTIAGMFGFSSKQYFQSTPGTEVPPPVKF